MRKSAAMSPTHRLRRCRALFNHRLAFRHYLLFKRPGVVRRSRIRTIVAEGKPRNRAFNLRRSRATNADRWITDRSRHANVFWSSGRVTMPCRTREWMDDPASVRAQTCNRIGRRRRCLGGNRRSAFLRLRACPSKGCLRSPNVQCRSRAVFRRPRVASSDPQQPIPVASSDPPCPILTVSSVGSRPIPVTAWSEASIGRNLAATKGTGSRIQVEDKAGGTAARIIAEL